MTERTSRVVQGQGLSATRENRLAQNLDDLNDLVRPDFGGVDETQAHSQLMRITDVASTALLAIAGTQAPVGGETIFTVRLPDDLLATAWPGGVTVTHTNVNTASATDGTIIEDWIMTKAYEVGSVIETFEWEDDGVFIDRNIAGRMWAAVPVVSGGGG